MRFPFSLKKTKKEEETKTPGSENDLDIQVMPLLDEVKPSKPKLWQKLRKPVLFSIAGLLILGSGYFGYTKLFSKKTEIETPQLFPKTPEIILPEPEPVEVDSDQDGLLDKRELELGTLPEKPDTDGDGIADGDEVNIYLSDPLLVDSDNDGFQDGREIAHSYSPIQNTPEKADSQLLARWAEKIATFGLHEPTKTTIRLENLGQESQVTTFHNSLYNYQLELPSVLTFREGEEGRLVGIYIAGTEASDSDIYTDPITVSIAVKVEAESLKEWVESQYQPQDYEDYEELSINSLPAIRLTRVKNEVCPQEKTFFAKDSLIVIITWTCSNNTAFTGLYEEILESFKFL